jgi:hypothetical protein
MIRSTTALVLSLLISQVLSLDAQAQSAMITEQEAHAIGVNAYLYFYSLLSMDITRKQSTHRTGQRVGQRSDEHVRQHTGIPTGELQRCRAIQLRYFVFHRMARHDEGARRSQRAGHQRALLPSADARHVDRCFRLAGLADDRHSGRDFCGDASGLATRPA